MKILCIDDNLEEIRRAEAAIKNAGHESTRFCIEETVCLSDALDLIGEHDAVVSDLFFNAVPKRHPAYVRQSDLLPPAGLLVVIHARALGKPVILCTSMDSEEGDHDREYHHGWRYGWLYDGSIGRKTGWHLPIVGRKDWEAAVESVLKQAAEPAR